MEKEVKVKEQKRKMVDLPVAVWHCAKVEAAKRDMRLRDWLAEAVEEKLERENGGKG